ncbi:MAG: hypothetical protein JNJ54_29150 [Myxococcaceae bacterium]|nr:hypothetical protein [Myxococcaceae bacterium]
MVRPSALLLVVALSGACQCLVPVEEGDGGVVADAGAAAGADGGGPVADGGVECSSPADCRGTSWATRWCGAGGGGFSCVANRCVAECSVAAKTCSVDARAECASCGAEPVLCVADDCSTNAFTASLSSVECRPGVTPTLAVNDLLSFVPIRGASCELSVSAPSRGLGQLYRARSGSRQFWFARELGGWCVGEHLPTGAIRSQVACPLCTLVVEGL